MSQALASRGHHGERSGKGLARVRIYTKRCLVGQDAGSGGKPRSEGTAGMAGSLAEAHPLTHSFSKTPLSAVSAWAPGEQRPEPLVRQHDARRVRNKERGEGRSKANVRATASDAIHVPAPRKSLTRHV